MDLLRRSLLSGFALVLLSTAISGTAPNAVLAQKSEQGSNVVVFAAASLKNALDAASAQWQTDTGKKAVISYAASSALAKQIEQGAPAGVFISADLDWMDYLAKKDLIDQSSRSNLFGNRLVLVAPKATASAVEIKKGFDLAKVVGEGRLAVGQVDSVPAGKYAKAALTNLGVWDSVAGKLAQTENVRAALALVSRGEAAAGIVYQTDAAADKTTVIIGIFPEDSHPPIIYPAALTKGAASPDAASFLNFLKSQKAKPLFEAQGFTILR
jgi:molybdate transport system substrate-binding protein